MALLTGPGEVSTTVLNTQRESVKGQAIIRHGLEPARTGEHLIPSSLNRTVFTQFLRNGNMANDRWHKRRAFLAAAATGVSGLLGGCSSIGGSEESPTTEPRAPTLGEGDDETPTETAEPTETEPQPPNARFTVNNDGSGDYESLQEAYDVATDGDVIEIAGGTYSYQPDVSVEDGEYDEELSKILTFIGQSSSETTIRIEPPEYEDSSSEGELIYDEPGPTYWHTTLEVADSLTFDSSTGAPSLELYYTNLRGGVGSGTAMTAYDSTLDFSNDRNRAPEIRAEQCTFPTAVSIKGEAINCVFEGLCRGPFDTQSSLDIVDSDLQEGVTFRAGDLVIEGCRISYDSESLVAVEAADEPTNQLITGSEIEGRITASETGAISGGDHPGRIGEISDCRFTAPDGVDYFIDGYPVVNLYRNAFEGADIRIAEPAEQAGEVTTVYDSERELGNYYSEWDGGEGNGEGVSELPRQIPGDAGVVDQYPLMHPDLDRYDA